jgi:hypothetical protein
MRTGVWKMSDREFPVGNKVIRLPKYIAQRVTISQSGCWLCSGFQNNGYSKITKNHITYLAHRFMYELAYGPIPKNKQLDHLCRVRNCVNPEHLEPVTLSENVLRGEGITANNARKEQCPYGHEYSGGNLYVDKRGFRYCKRCKAETSYAKYWEKAGRSPTEKIRQGRPIVSGITGERLNK